VKSAAKSFWIWLFAVSGMLIRCAVRLSLTLRWLVNKQDIDKKPIQSNGRVAALGVCATYLAGAFGCYLTTSMRAAPRPQVQKIRTVPERPTVARPDWRLKLPKCKDSHIVPRERRTSRCDLDGNGVVNECDVNLARDAVLGVIPCEADIDGDGVCTVMDVQRVVNASLKGGTCRVGPNPRKTK
jgi:hypothetical protein